MIPDQFVIEHASKGDVGYFLDSKEPFNVKLLIMTIALRGDWNFLVGIEQCHFSTKVEIFEYIMESGNIEFAHKYGRRRLSKDEKVALRSNRYHFPKSDGSIKYCKIPMRFFDEPNPQKAIKILKKTTKLIPENFSSCVTNQNKTFVTHPTSKKLSPVRSARFLKYSGSFYTMSRPSLSMSKIHKQKMKMFTMESKSISSY